jgi:uncharacterized membrane protein
MTSWDWLNRHDLIAFVQQTISGIGILIILSGVLFAFYQYILYYFHISPINAHPINSIRLNLTRILILGLEFIVAADLIATTTAPDYYSVGIVAIVVIIRTVLSYSLNREIAGLNNLMTSAK